MVYIHGFTLWFTDIKLFKVINFNYRAKSAYMALMVRRVILAKSDKVGSINYYFFVWLAMLLTMIPSCLECSTDSMCNIHKQVQVVLSS